MSRRIPAPPTYMEIQPATIRPPPPQPATNQFPPPITDSDTPQQMRLLTPRMSPIITGMRTVIPPIILQADYLTDGIVSLVITDDYRFRPYLIPYNGGFAHGSVTEVSVADVTHRYIMGVGLDQQEKWLQAPLQNGLRTMATSWVLYYDCNPDMILERPRQEQNEYLATRDRLGLPLLRWAGDLSFMATQRRQSRQGAGR